MQVSFLSAQTADRGNTDTVTSQNILVVNHDLTQTDSLNTDTRFIFFENHPETITEFNQNDENLIVNTDIAALSGGAIEIVDNSKYIEGITRNRFITKNYWITVVIWICFIIVVICYAKSSNFLHTIFKEFTEEKPRQGFYLTSTASVMRLKYALLAMTFVVEALALYVFLNNGILRNVEVIDSWIFFAAFLLFFVILYFSQLFVFWIVGYVFTSKALSLSWLSAFSGSTMLFGLLLFLPVLASVYYTIPIKTFAFIIIGTYILTRLLFIYKGVKIFFKGFDGLIYLILYLCTLEIAPILVIYKVLNQIIRIVELKFF